MWNAEYSVHRDDGYRVIYPKSCFMPKLQCLLNLCIVLGSMSMGGGVISSMISSKRKQREI